MQRETIAGLTAHIAGGTDGNGGGDGPVVMLMHGFGAPGDDLAALWRVIDVPRGTRWVFPEAPNALPANYGAGRAWWMVDFERRERATREGRLDELVREEPDGMSAARTKASAFLDALPARFGVTRNRIVVGGFSQGAMLSCDLALRADQPFAGLVLMSGTLVTEPSWRALAPRHKGFRVFQSHGREDALLAFPLAERLRDLLREAGIDVSWVPFRGGHEIPPTVLDGLGVYLNGVLKSAD